MPTDQVRQWSLVQSTQKEYTLGLTLSPPIADSVKRSAQGKIAAATQATSAEYLKPLFKSLRKRVRRAFLHCRSTLSPEAAAVLLPGRTSDAQALPSQELDADVLRNIAEITHYMQKREYLRANDAYLRLSIGNAPWPIGVTMVGVRCVPALYGLFWPCQCPTAPRRGRPLNDGLVACRLSSHPLADASYVSR